MPVPRRFALLAALAAGVPMAAEAQGKEGAVRFAIASVSATNAVEDCPTCEPPDRIYFAVTAFRVQFGSPESVAVRLTFSDRIEMAVGDTLRLDPDVPDGPSGMAVTIPHVLFATAEEQPMVIGAVVTPLEANPGRSGVRIEAAARDAVAEVLVPLLTKEIGDRRLGSSDLTAIPRIVAGVIAGAMEGQDAAIEREIRNRLRTGEDPDHRMPSFAFAASAFSDAALAAAVEAAGDTRQFVALSLDDIGRRDFGITQGLFYDALRFHRVRAEYEIEFRGAALE